MLASLKTLLFGAGEAEVAAGRHDAAGLHRAAAGLLVEAALLDGHFHDEERRRIGDLLRDRFALSVAEADSLVAAAETAAGEKVESYTVTRTLRDHFDPSERVRMIEMLWEVVYADGELDDFESNMMRRMTGLLYVTDRESGAARKRVRERLGF